MTVRVTVSVRVRIPALFSLGCSRRHVTVNIVLFFQFFKMRQNCRFTQSLMMSLPLFWVASFSVVVELSWLEGSSGFLRLTEAERLFCILR